MFAWCFPSKGRAAGTGSAPAAHLIIYLEHDDWIEPGWMQPPHFLALLMDVESPLSRADKGLAVVREGEPLLSLCKRLRANPVKNCWKIVDHRKQDCKSPQGIGWFIPPLPQGNRSYQREAVLKYPKNLSHALCVFSVYQEGFPDVSHCEGGGCAFVLLHWTRERWWKCPKMGTAAGTRPCSLCTEALGTGQGWASHWGAQ